MIIHRPLVLKRFKNVRKWAFIYGRRKTGKSFLIENFIKYDEYFFVDRDRTLFSKLSGTQISYDAFIEILMRGLKENKTIVVDEFHRLGDSFMDRLHAIGHGGKLILITSTLFLAKKMLYVSSPLLGLFNEVQVHLVTLDDALTALGGYGLDKRRLVESAIMLREPIMAPYFKAREGTMKAIMGAVMGSVLAVPALIGEIFQEEERSLSATYEGIIRAVASGKVVSGEISSSLYSRGLITKDDPSAIQPYLNNLVRIGILSRIAVYHRKKFVYKITSPLMRLFFYADEKYGLSRREMPDAELERILHDVFPKIVEDNIREYLAWKYGLEEQVLEAADYDVDGVLVKFKKPDMLLEVKWRKKISGADIKDIETSMGKIKARRRLLFVQDKKGLSSKELDIIDASDLLHLPR